MSIKSLPAALVAIIFTASLPAISFAQATDSDQVTATQQEQDQKAKAYDDAVKDLTKVDGNLVLYRRQKDILLALPEDKVGQILLVQATLETGLDSAFMHAGMPVDGNEVDAFRLDRHDGEIWLVRPNLAHRWSKGDAFAPGAERQFQEAVLGSFKIEKENPDKKLLLVNVTKMFYGDIFHLSEMIMQGLGGPYMLDGEKSGPQAVRGFPDNDVVQMGLYYVSPRGLPDNPIAEILGTSTPNTLEDDRSAPVKVTYTLWYRKDDGYRARVADPRIGYFTESFFSVDKYLNADRTEEYINRVHLEKKDPSAKLSDPVKPIVYTIDNSIPPEYRDAVKEGVLRWNKAFEAIGYRNAIQVQNQPDDPNYDHADGRHNVIRMMVSPGSPFGAISLFRTDPFTGEILNASITLDGNMIRDIQEEHLRVQESHFGGKRAFDVLMRDAKRSETDDHYLFATDQERAKEQLLARMSAYGWSNDLCTYAEGAETEAILGWDAIQGAPHNVNKEEYAKKFLADTVSHEVGHTLGLRHNFAGSTNLTTAQLANDQLTDQVGISASVMDYSPPNVQAILRGNGNFYSPVIGPYDIWAIQYGYQEFGSKDPVGDKFHLAQIANESGKHGLAYMTDEDADSWDPYAVRFDGASDPLNFSQKMVLAMKRAQEYAITNLPKSGESYEKRTQVLMSSYVSMFKEGRNAARFVGGMVANRNYRGEAGEKPTLAPVDSALQRQAAKMIVHDFLMPDAFRLPSSVLTSLTLGPDQTGWTAPLRDFLGSYQSNMVALMLSANTEDRIAENEFKVKDAYGLDEHYKMITDAVFEEVGENVSIEPLRRDLQNFTMNALITIGGAGAGQVNDDARMLANYSLKQLNGRIAAQLRSASKLDSMTKIHLHEMNDTISRFLGRQD